jgi:hypothetical protein
MNSDFITADFCGAVTQPVIAKTMKIKLSEASVDDSACLPLTLTLSPGEREQPLFVFSNLQAGRVEASRVFAQTLETILPLPGSSRRSAAKAEGEGRGEGERDAKSERFIR